MSNDTICKGGETLTQADVVSVCQALKKHELRLLSLRDCLMETSDLQRVLKLAGSCRSLHQLTLSLGVVSSPRHVELLAACLAHNNSLTGLHLHGSKLGDDGMRLVGKSLASHPGIVSLDVGDCQLGDTAVDVLYDLLLPENARPALQELTLSANSGITAAGWARLSMAVANCPSLRLLMLDYNPLGDYAASLLLVAVAATQNMEVLDLEGCGLTEHTGQLILHLVQNHLGSLSKIVLHGNRVRRSTVEAIRTYLRENHMDTESETTATSDLDFDLELTSITSDSSSQRSSTKSTKVKKMTTAGSVTEDTTSDSDDASTLQGSAAEEYVRALSAKEQGAGEEKEKDDDEDSLGEELTEVPVFYA